MSDQDPQLNLTEEQRTELVSYLDGELDETDSRRVQELLAASSAARREADEMTRAWEVLDVLDQVRASDEFTARTLSSIQASSAETDRAGQTQTDGPVLRQRLVLGGWVLGVVVSAAAGFVVTNWAMPERSAKIVEDLPVIEDLQTYEQVEDAEFLRELKERELFDGN